MVDGVLIVSMSINWFVVVSWFWVLLLSGSVNLFFLILDFLLPICIFLISSTEVMVQPLQWFSLVISFRKPCRLLLIVLYSSKCVLLSLVFKSIFILCGSTPGSISTLSTCHLTGSGSGSSLIYI